MLISVFSSAVKHVFSEGYDNVGDVSYNIDRHSLLDAKINSVLSLCHDQVILNAVHRIIQNMIACEDVSQQQLSYLQSKLSGKVAVQTALHSVRWCLCRCCLHVGHSTALL